MKKATGEQGQGLENRLSKETYVHGPAPTSLLQLRGRTSELQSNPYKAIISPNVAA